MPQYEIEVGVRIEADDLEAAEHAADAVDGIIGSEAEGFIDSLNGTVNEITPAFIAESIAKVMR